MLICLCISLAQQESHLNSLVDTPQCSREVLHGDVHVLELLGEFLPLVIPEGGEVEVDQLGRESGELIVQTDAVVTSHGDVALLVLRARLPGVRVNHLGHGVPHSHSYGSVAPLQNLVGDVERGALVNVLPVAVLLARLHVDFVLHGNARSRVQRVVAVEARWRRRRGGRCDISSVAWRELRLLLLLLLLLLHLCELLR